MLTQFKPTPSPHWAKALRIARALQSEVTDPEELTSYAQRVMCFEHRTNSTELSTLHRVKIIYNMFGVDLSLVPIDAKPSVPEDSYNMINQESGKEQVLTNIFFWHINTYLRIVAQDIEVSSILEIGGGYGALARIFRQLCPEISYDIIDFPECNKFAKAYLELAGVDGVTHHESTETLKDRYDLIINKGSLQEMDICNRDNWMKLIEERCNYFYSLNYEKAIDRPETMNIEPLNLDWSKWNILHELINPEIIKIDSSRNWRELILERKV